MTPMPDATCPRHPGVAAVGTCKRCGTFVCSADFKVLDQHTFCLECAARPDVDYLEAYRLKYWGKRDGWAWFFGLGGALNSLSAVAVLVSAVVRPDDRFVNLLLGVMLATWGVMGILYFLGQPIARVGLIVAVLLYGVVLAIITGGAGIVGIIVPLAVVGSAYANVRSKLFFKLDVPRASLKKEWDRLHNNTMARNAVTLGVGGLLIPGMSLFAILTGIIGWRRVDPDAHPPIGRKKSAIAGVVLGALGTLMWGAILIAALVNSR